MIHHWLYDYSNSIGLVGVVLVLFAYLTLQLNKMSPHRLPYTSINLIGSILILVSLYYHMNLASFVIEVAWLVISLFGVIKALFFSKRKALDM